MKDWQQGDVVTAADLQELTDAVSLLENMGRQLPQGSNAGAGVRRECDGPVEWPWQVLARPAAAGMELYVVPGRVLVGGNYEFTNTDGEVTGGFDYVSMAGNVVPVPGFDATQTEPQMVYLQLWGEVEVRQLQYGECWPPAEDEEEAEFNTDLQGQQQVLLKNARLELACAPVASSLLEQAGLLRVWPLAIYTPGHEQPVNQLQWGELSACECRGLVDSWGAVVWPAERGEAAGWGTDGHGSGMATLAEADFSTPRETITGPLLGCIDTDGAVEFYLGVHEAPLPDGPEPPVDPEEPTLEDEEEEDDGGGGDDDGGGGGDGEGDEDLPPDAKVAVQIGYEAGDGFSSCTLVRRAGGYFWKLELDPDFVRAAVQGLPVPATMTLAANGSQVGVKATVEMGLGSTAATAGGTAATGTAQLVFHGTNAVDASTKTRTHRFNYSVSLALEVPKRTWYLSPRQLSTAGSWVKLVRSNGASNFNVQAQEWWIWHVDRERFRQAGVNQMKIELAKRGLSDSDSSSSADSTVTGTLSGTALAIRAEATLS